MICDEFIQYREAKHGGEFGRLHDKTKQIATLASIISKLLFNENLLVTSIYRKKTNDSGIHEAYRAIDFKMLTKPEYTYRLIEILNAIYTYDPKRPNLKVAHENPFHGTGAHIHIQAHDYTTGLTEDKILALTAKAQADQTAFKPIALT